MGQRSDYGMVSNERVKKIAKMAKIAKRSTKKGAINSAHDLVISEELNAIVLSLGQSHQHMISKSFIIASGEHKQPNKQYRKGPIQAQFCCALGKSNHQSMW